MTSSRYPIEIKYYRQETQYSCGAAVARAVIASLFSLDCTEAALMEILNTSEQTGTARHSFYNLTTIAHSFARKLRVQTGTGATRSIEGITGLFTGNSLIAVNYLETTDDEGHWALVRSIDIDSICLSDPYHGERYTVPLGVFLERWRSGSVAANGIVEQCPWVAFYRLDEC